MSEGIENPEISSIDVTRVTSLHSTTTDLPPSCIDFCREYPNWFVVGTYHLEDEEAKKNNDSGEEHVKESDINSDHDQEDVSDELEALNIENAAASGGRGKGKEKETELSDENAISDTESGSEEKGPTGNVNKGKCGAPQGVLVRGGHLDFTGENANRNGSISLYRLDRNYSP
jgi:hypothetical protein